MFDTSIHPQSDPVALPGPPFGRQVRSIAGYSLLTALMIITPLMVFVPAALMHCAIRNGRRAAWTVLLFAVAIASLYVIAVPAASPAAEKMAWSYLAGISLAVALPTMASLPLVERGAKFGRVLVTLLVLSAAGLALTELGSRALLDFSPFASQVAQANETSVEFVQAYRAKGMSPEMIRIAERWVGYSTFVLPAVILINLTLVFVLSLLMLGRLKAWREITVRRGDKEGLGVYLFRNLSLPDWLLFAFILGGLTPLVTGLLQKVAGNLLALTAFLYILQGLAIFRFLLVAMGAGLAGTLLGWTLLAFLTITGVAPLLLGLAGLFDSFFDFRHYKTRKDNSDENHSD